MNVFVRIRACLQINEHANSSERLRLTRIQKSHIHTSNICRSDLIDLVGSISQYCRLLLFTRQNSTERRVRHTSTYGCQHTTRCIEIHLTHTYRQLTVAISHRRNEKEPRRSSSRCTQSESCSHTQTHSVFHCSSDVERVQQNFRPHLSRRRSRLMMVSFHNSCPSCPSLSRSVVFVVSY